MNTEKIAQQEHGQSSPILFLRGSQKPLPSTVKADFPDAAWKAVIASFPDPLFILGRDGQIEFQNAAACQFSQAWDFHDHLAESLIALVRQAFRTGEDYLPHDFQGSLQLQSQEEHRRYLPKIVLQRDATHAISGALLALQDITAFHNQDELKSDLLTTASHEIKTPLTSIRTTIYLLLEQAFGKLNPKQLELAQDARENVEQVLLLINQLLDLDSLENGNEPLNLQTVDVMDLIDSANREVKDQLRFKDLQLTVEVGSFLPPLQIDRQRINIVLRNLLSNAIRYSPVGGEIVLRAFLSPEGNVGFAIKDHGPGIAPPHQARIFEKFYRVPGQRKSGTGLGLAIARQNVLLHKGTIGCKSDVGSGSEFCVILPAGSHNSVSPNTTPAWGRSMCLT